MFSSTMENLFDEPANLEVFPPNAYIHLLYTVSFFILCIQKDEHTTKSPLSDSTDTKSCNTHSFAFSFNSLYIPQEL